EVLGFSVILAAILGLMFFESFLPDRVLFSNDGPLGVQSARFLALPEGMTGLWDDLNSIGFPGAAWPPSITMSLRWSLGAVGFAKFYAPIALFILGICAWWCFKQFGFSRQARALAGLGTVLSSVFFSTVCWGVGSQQIGIGMDFIALGMVVSSERSRNGLERFARLALAGAAIGMSIMEGLDNGAIFSVLIAAFTVFRALVNGTGPVLFRVIKGIGRTALIAVCAGLVAAQVIVSLVSTQIQGVAGMAQDEQSKQSKWDWATTWSFPKREVLSFLVPGVYGFRMDTPDGGNYWGAVGRDPSWDRYFANGEQGNPRGAMRFSGGGAYLGVIVALIIFWAVLQSFLKDSAFSVGERRLHWFWLAVAIVSLLLSFGRFAPFYRLVYALPYFSTIRNPIKFTSVVNFALVILFAHGIQAFLSRYANAESVTTAPKLKSRQDRRWIMGCFVAVVLAIVGWIVYGSMTGSMVNYLQKVQFDEAQARSIASFSVRQVGWFIAFLIAGIIAMAMIMRGQFAGTRAKWAGVLLGALLLVDLVKADLPWTLFWDYKQKYESNPIVDKLREKPYEQRVIIFPSWLLQLFQVPDQFKGLQNYIGQLYGIEWAQHHFPYYNIQSLDIVQMPRPPADLLAYDAALSFLGTPDSIGLLVRKWELTNTRFILAPAAFIDLLNQGLDKDKLRFRIAERFEIDSKPGVFNPRKLEELTASINTNGRFALIEFTGALPRAKLYGSWHVSTNSPAVLDDWVNTVRKRTDSEAGNALAAQPKADQATLKELGSPSFDSTKAVLLATPLPASIPSVGTNQNNGSARYVSYAPKDIVLKTESSTASILLLNDKYDPTWRVLVDGKPADLLRCNFIMRGVYLSAGNHDVEFIYKTDPRPMYVTLTALGLAFVMIGYVTVSSRKETVGETTGTKT
ncbi:MAG TPA: hypothetical protein VK327_16390, partial [Candidatus Paceibacterota bacterium]|nr:hypothetical protein [Candidatus Paceibacterota bacterium]